MASINDDIDSKMYQEVQKMLEGIYTKEKIPDYEVNPTTIRVLYRVALKMKKRKEIEEAQIKYHSRLAETYETKGIELKERLESIGSSMDNIPKDCVSASEALARAAVSLDLKEPNTTNFLLALNELSRKKLDLANDESRWSRKLEKLTKKIAILLEQVETLTRDIETTREKHKIQSSEASKRKTQTSFLSNKIEEYKRKVVSLEMKLKESGCHPSIYHSAVMKTYEELQKFQEKLDVVKLKLESYNNLPPNENLARLKVEEAKMELFTLEQELQQKIELKSKEALPSNF